MCDGIGQEGDEGKVSAKQEAAKTAQPWPEEALEQQGSWLASLYQRWTYSYMSYVLDKGSRQTPLDDGHRLSADDLFAVPTTMEASFLADEFRKHYEKAKDSKRRLIITLWYLAAPTFIPAGFCQLITVLCQTALPLLVRELLQTLEDNPSQSVVAEGLPYAIGLFMTLVLNGVGNHRHRHLAMKSGVVMRAAAVNVLYEHALKLTPKGREGLTSGEITNLIAVDTQKLFEVAQEGHLCWSLPLAVILVTIFLLLIMGPVTLIGITVLILFIPLVGRVTSSMLAIRQKRVKMTDKRIEIASSMLQGIKVTKLNNYESSYTKRVTEAREAELAELRKELAVWAATLFLIVTSPVLASAATFAVYVLASEDNILTAAKTFSVLLLFSALRFPINYAGRLVGKATQAYSAIERITSFLEREVGEGQDDTKADKGQSSDDPPLSLANASFRIGRDSPSEPSPELKTNETSTYSFKVAEFNLNVKRGEVLAVCGPVGAGKSTLIQGIINEVPTASPETHVSTAGVVSYVPQSPFIMNTTLRENILFGRPFNSDDYERVLDACCLRPDMEQLGPSKDLTEIGERGVTLSGGQKQRVSLARAAYGHPDLVLLDDPLSALDAGTAKLVFERLIRSENALFKSAAVVLVTHASHFLNRVDQIMVIVDGSNNFLGSWRDLSSYTSTDAKTQSAIEFIRSAVQEEEAEAKPSVTSSPELTINDSKDKQKGKLMTVEEREHGLSSMSTWLLWFARAGGVFFFTTQVFFMSLDRAAYVAVEYWLARWTEASDQPIEVMGFTFPSQLDGRSAQFEFLAVYIIILTISIAATILRSEWAVTGGARAAKTVFSSMLASVLRAPVSYFETTPMGRILNRFTYDMEVVDVTLTQNMSMFLISCSWYVAGVVLMCTILPWIAFAVFPVTGLYWMLLLHYRKSGADLQRLDALSRSPIQAMVSEGIDGTATIKVFKQEKTFLARFRKTVDINSSALLNFVSAQRWLGFRIEILGSFIVLVSSTLVITFNDSLKLESGIVGLLILWSGNFTITLGFLVDTFGDAEASITAIERVDAMANLPREKSMQRTDKNSLPPSWPESGRIEFDNVCLRYRQGLPLALDNLSFEIPAGKSCGVVGRTGAGKSSLTVALFRLTEIESGSIRLDGIDLGSLALSDVRGRPNGMAIIPQDPFLAGSTLRECLDPFGRNSDTDILDALKAVRLCASTDDISALDTHLEEGGSNYSVGERQLLNLCAALLRKSKVLVLDEATASIDGETDAFIQQMLRTRFKNTTLITVAHRLNTIMDYDLVLVMDAGRAVELGPPAELLDRNGMFAELVDATGKEGSEALRAIAHGTRE